MELLYQPLQDLDTAGRIKRVGDVLALLTTARKHAFFAAASPDAPDEEKDFLHFLQLIFHNVQSAQAMIQHQSHLEGEEGFLCQFLGASPEECALPAQHYRRRADDILQGIWHLLRLGHKPYRALQQKNLVALTDEERARYTKAYPVYRGEISA
jgi:hypothetical protein